MEEHNENHSDSDSGESWTLLEASPSYATDTPPHHSAVPVIAISPDDKDEDTDGISIISDCDSEHMSEQIKEDMPAEQTECSPIDQGEEATEAEDNCTSLTAETDERNLYDEFLGDSSKLKTYVHKRNNKVSSMLNVILLGSVITAAGIALGHMWGVRDDCAQHKFPSVNKILSNLYKLQEENEFLRSKLKELTFATHTQYHNIKKSVQKPNKCRKLVDEPLNSVNIVKTTKCTDPDLDAPRSTLDFVKTELPLPFDSLEDSVCDREIIGEEFKADINKLKNFYKENKKWLDKEITKRLKAEKRMQYSKDRLERAVLQEKPIHEPNKLKEVVSDNGIDSENISAGVSKQEHRPSNIVSYADSLKNPSIKRDDDADTAQKSEERKSKINRPNKKMEKKYEKFEMDFSEDEDLTPTDKRRYVNKYKSDKHRIDRRSRYKKDKRGNKYQQWEMKGGYLKDYDSIASLISEDIPIADVNNNRMSQDWEIYVTHVNKKRNEKKKKREEQDEKKTDFVIVNKTSKEKLDTGRMEQSTEQSLDEGWFERRSASRRHARELKSDFPTNFKYKINSRWYFRRMSDREKSRARVDENKRPKSQRRNYKTRR